MNTTESVLGVLGLCWVRFGKPTRIGATETVVCGGVVLGVLGLCAHARVRDFFRGTVQRGKNLYARAEKPNTPNTLNTYLINPLISLIFNCVGFVLGKPNMCWVQVLGGSR